MFGVDMIAKFLGSSVTVNEYSPSVIVEVYAWLLLAYGLVKAGKFDQVVEATEHALSICDQHHHRALDPLQAKLYFYLSLAFEQLGNLVDLRHKLMLALRSTSLRHDCESQAVVYNWILRSYVLSEQHDLASKFVARSPFPANASNAQSCRHHFYLARVEAIQTNYDAAREHLQLAIRKAPHADSSLGLLQKAHKLLVVVQLLLGDIPERSLFAQPKLARSLQPYLALCQAVRLGDLARFQKVLTDNSAGFNADANGTIIARLHQNVLRTGLKRLNQAYSRISLADVAHKLGLPSVDDAEFVVLKAIKDGVISASVDHAQQFMQSKTITNAYYTEAPHAELHERIQSAQAVYRASMMSMRYPSGTKPSGPVVDLESLDPNDMDMFEEYMDDDGMDF